MVTKEFRLNYKRITKTSCNSSQKELQYGYSKGQNLETVKIFFFLFRDIERRPILLRLLSFSAVRSALHRQYLKCVCKKTRRFRRVFLFAGEVGVRLDFVTFLC